MGTWVFFIEHVTETTLENAVIRLVNAVVLFYGLMVGACRRQWGDEEQWKIQSSESHTFPYVQ